MHTLSSSPILFFLPTLHPSLSFATFLSPNHRMCNALSAPRPRRLCGVAQGLVAAAAAMMRRGEDGAANDLLSAAEKMTRGGGGGEEEEGKVRRRVRSAVLNNIGCLHKRCVYPPLPSPPPIPSSLLAFSTFPHLSLSTSLSPLPSHPPPLLPGTAVFQRRSPASPPPSACAISPTRISTCRVCSFPLVKQRLPWRTPSRPCFPPGPRPPMTS